MAVALHALNPPTTAPVAKWLLFIHDVFGIWSVSKMNLPALYHSVILWIGDGTGLPDAILHIHAGLAILMIARLISRYSLGTFFPLLFVVILEVGNEFMDYMNYGWRAADTLTDLANTWFWPVAISLGVRLRPFERHRPKNGWCDQG